MRSFGYGVITMTNTSDRDAVENMVRRRGLASTVRLVAQATASTSRYYQATRNCNLDDVCYVCAWDVAQAFLDNVAGDISQAMKRI